MKHTPILRTILPALFCISLLEATNLCAASPIPLDAGNGPSDQRYNLVWITEGFSAAQMDHAMTQIRAQWNYLTNTAVFREYRPFLNGYAIPAIWTRADPNGSFQQQDLPFINQTVASVFPEADLIVVFANGPFDYAGIVMSGPPLSRPMVRVANNLETDSNVTDPTTAVHEIGHVIGSLADETPCTGLTPNTPSKPNKTGQFIRELIPWNAWIDPNTPIPTPPNFPIGNGVGVYRNGCDEYVEYIPQGGCLMTYDRISDLDFCVVCREALVLGLYGTPRFNAIGANIGSLRPIQTFSPVFAGVTAAAGQGVEFSVQVRTTATQTHPFSYQWYLDGAPIAGANAASYVYSSDGGTHQVAVRVHDDTPWVRTDPNNFLYDSVFWTVNETGIALVNPLPDAVFRGAVQIKATVTPKAGAVQRVEFYAGSTFLGTIFSAPYSFFWINNVPEGLCLIRAKVVSQLNGIETAAWSMPVRAFSVGWDLNNLGANLASGVGSEAFGINDSGRVVGRVNFASGSARAFVTGPYSPITLASDDLDPLGWYYQSVGYRINNAGSVVGNTWRVPPSGLQSQAFQIAPGTQLPEPPPLSPPPSFYSGANGLNENGDTVGWLGDGTDPYAFSLWPEFVQLGGTAWTPSMALGINNAKRIVGFYIEQGNPHAFSVLLSEAQSGGLAVRRIADPEVATSSEAFAINESGQVAGRALFVSQGEVVAFRTAPNSNLQDSDRLQYFGNGSVAYGLNNLGEAVGSSSARAFFNKDKDATLDLNRVLPPSSGWVLHEARGINNASDIVGSGTYQGLLQAYLLKAKPSPPAPSPIQITSPADGAVFLEIENPVSPSLLLAAQVGSPFESFSVEFLANGQVIGSDSVPPYHLSWPVVPDGTYVLTARATDSLGRLTISPAVNITVDGPPVVQIASPQPGANVPQGLVQIVADASDAVGGINRVEFLWNPDLSCSAAVDLLDLLGTVYQAPYVLNVSGAQIGPISVRVRVVSNNGQEVTDCVTFNVVERPQVSITSATKVIREAASASVTLQRNGTAANPITVQIGVSGDATLGSDYQILIGGVPVTMSGWQFAVTFPAGETTKQITLQTLDDQAAENSKSVTLALLADSAYTIGSAAHTLTILDGEATIVAGHHHSLCIRPDLNGTVWAWGNNQYGQLGDGTTVNRLTFVTATGLSGIVGLSASTAHSLAVKDDGAVWAWGNNTHGRLGDGTSIAKIVPTQLGTINQVVDVSAGGSHSLALKSDGTVWAWGYNADGQMGTGVLGGEQLAPAQVPGLQNVVAISAGGAHSMVLKADGTVWAWGANANGQLGDTTNLRRLTPVQVTGISGVRSIAIRQDKSHAVRYDGTVWSWGQNTGGALGDGTTVTRYSPVQMVGVNDVKTIAAGYFHTVILKNDGSVLACGANTYGPVGDGTTIARTTAVPCSGLILNPAQPMSIAAGYSHSLASMWNMSTMLSWGYNAYGQLGDGTQIHRSIPGSVAD